MNKTIDAAAKQVANIEFIEATVGLEKLPDKLKEIVRLENSTSALKSWANDPEWSYIKVRHQSPFTKNQ